MKVGPYIILEGVEGSGKSSQVRRLAQIFSDCGINAIAVREPGGTRLGEEIRSLVLDQSSAGMAVRTGLLLFAGARAELVDKVVRPQLQSGGTVISDRGFLSTLAYQAYGEGLDPAVVLDVCKIALGDVWPNLVIVLDVPIEVGLRRRLGGTDILSRFDVADIEFHQRVRNGLLTEAGNHGYPVVDGTGTEELTTDLLLNEITRYLPEISLSRAQPSHNSSA